MMILGGSTSKSLAMDLANVLGLEFVQAHTKRFPDGEAYVRIDRESLDKEVVLVQNTYPDGNLVELLLLLDAARGLGADKITCVIPYFGYARQDRRFNPGEALSAKVMLRHLEMEMDRLLTIDLHKPDVLEWFARAPAKDLKAAPAIGDFFRGHGIDLVLGPDKGAVGRAAEVAKIIGCESDHLEKTRLSGTEVKIAPSYVGAKGKRVLIVDDIISTGGTIIAASNELKRLGAREVFAACTHGLFTGGAVERLRGACDMVVSTNTLESEVSKISVAKVVAQEL
ncbi:MAG: ribose-phosphate diphosphokinase [Methanomassiliicoccales archaeon]|nr:ribose-phosphate diphosphokinase [Methanomassiliicoccales archaeon]MDD1756064.1 ribose-phosphate diphosphokinase [Methanomassiliicoccales archaeon]